MYTWGALVHRQFDKMVLIHNIFIYIYTHEINKIQFRISPDFCIGRHYISAIIHLSLIMFLSRWKYSHFPFNPRPASKVEPGNRRKRGMQNITSVLGLRISVCCVAISIIAPQFSLFFSSSCVFLVYPK